MAKKEKKTARIDLRVHPKVKKSIRLAAEKRGTDMSSLIFAAVQSVIAKD